MPNDKNKKPKLEADNFEKRLDDLRKLAEKIKAYTEQEKYEQKRNGDQNNNKE